MKIIRKELDLFFFYKMFKQILYKAIYIIKCLYRCFGYFINIVVPFSLCILVINIIIGNQLSKVLICSILKLLF